MRSFIKVQKPDGEVFDFGFAIGDEKAQRALRQMAIHTVLIQAIDRERDAILAQFVNLPFNKVDVRGPLTYYGDMAKFVARHLSLLSQEAGSAESVAARYSVEAE